MSEPLSLTVASPLSILIVEDEAMIAMMLEQYLDALGHRVSGSASSVDEAMALIGKADVDVAILDCYLGDVEVWPIADILKERGIPFILSSGGSATALPANHASCPILQKPYTIAALAELLTTIS